MAIKKTDRKARANYKKKVEVVRFELYPTEADIKEHLAAIVAAGGKKARYIKDLIRKDMSKESGIYVVFRDSQDDYCDIKGFIRGTEEEVEEYCNTINKDCKYDWQEYTWEKLEDLHK